MWNITHNHCLQGRPSPDVLPDILSDKSVTNCSSWKQAQQLYEQFWHRFQKEYMPTLFERGKGSTPTPNVQPGDLVWLLEDFTPRGLWPMTRVDEVFPGADGVLRSCILKTTYGYIHRPVKKLSKYSVDFVNKTRNFALLLPVSIVPLEQ